MMICMDILVQKSDLMPHFYRDIQNIINLIISSYHERRWLGVRTAGLEFRKVAGSNPRSGRVPMSIKKKKTYVQ